MYEFSDTYLHEFLIGDFREIGTLHALLHGDLVEDQERHTASKHCSSGVYQQRGRDNRKTTVDDHLKQRGGLTVLLT